MVGRREKSMTHRALPNDENTGPGRFRRKLSDGLSFIVSPLAQRKSLQPQQNKNSFLPAAKAPATKVHGPSQAVTGPQNSRIGSVPLQKSSTQYHLGKPQDEAGEMMGSDRDSTAKPLPRSHTMSFIPRPSRRESSASTLGSDTGTIRRLPVCSPNQDDRDRPSKIPTPSPTATIRRHTSAQESAGHHTIHNTPCDATSIGLVAPTGQPRANASIRSYSSSSLTKRVCSTQLSSVLARNLAMPTAPLAPNISWPKNVTFEENTSRPAYRSHRYSRGLSKIPESSPNRQNTVVSTNLSENTSLGSVDIQRAGGHGSPVTSAARGPQNSQDATQTLQAVQMPPHSQSHQSPSNTKSESSCPNNNSIAHTRLMGPVNPPTPLIVKTGAPRLSLRQSKIEKNPGVRSPMKSMRRKDVIASQVCASMNREVRLPQSVIKPTRVRARVSAPPVPPIPDQFKSQSMPLIVKDEIQDLDQDKTPLSRPISVGSHPMDTGDKDTHNPFDVVNQEDGELLDSTIKIDKEAGDSNSEAIQNKRLPRSFSGPFRLFSASRTPSAPLPRSATLQVIERHANVVSHTQVKNYMPMSYWAGRFQSQFDQWRTGAMAYELDVHKGRPESLGSYGLHQEDKAACEIFLQLRNLCVSSQAADSLWEFEYSYRRIHRLLGKDYDFAPLNPRKHSDSDSRNGPIVRAVRKLTPRKSSFVNLLKGKGWNKEETKSPEYKHESLADTSPEDSASHMK